MKEYYRGKHLAEMGLTMFFFCDLLQVWFGFLDLVLEWTESSFFSS